MKPRFVVSFLFVLAIVFIAGGARADLPTNFREHFPSLVSSGEGFKSYFEQQELLNKAGKGAFEGTDTLSCYGTREYDLDQHWTDVRDAYHEMMNGLFSDAFESARSETDTALGEYTTHGVIALEPPVNKYQGKWLQRIQKQQASQGFTSKCKDNFSEDSQFTGDSVPTDYFSPCRVAETALNEWCAYSSYIWAKMRDERTLGMYDPVKDVPTAKEQWGTTVSLDPGKTETLGDRTFLIEKKRDQLMHEFAKAKQTLWQMLETYRIYEQNYRLHVWFDHAKQSLVSIDGKWQTFRESFYTYPEKFVNAAAKRCH